MADTLIESVSDTAFWIAHYRAVETKRRDALFRDPLAGVLAGDRGEKIARAMPMSFSATIPRPFATTRGAAILARSYWMATADFRELFLLGSRGAGLKAIPAH